MGALAVLSPRGHNRGIGQSLIAQQLKGGLDTPKEQRALPQGVDPSQAGGGRGTVAPNEADRQAVQSQQTTQRMRTLADAQPQGTSAALANIKANTQDRNQRLGVVPDATFTADPLSQPSQNTASQPASEPAMVQPEFVAKLRESLGAMPPEKRMAALQGLTQRSDVTGRAARQLMGDVAGEQSAQAAATDQVYGPGGGQATRQAIRQAPPSAGQGGAVAIPDVTPNVADIADMASPAEIAGRRGEDAALGNAAAGSIEASHAQRRQAEANRQSGFGKLSPSQLGKDFLGGIEDVKGLAKSARAYLQSASWRDTKGILADMDAIDAGKNPSATDGMASNVKLAVRAYEEASPERRQAMREGAQSGLQQNQDFIKEAAKAVQDYSAKKQELSGSIPNFTDVSTAKEFAEWALRNGVATTPTMAASMLSSLAGPAGLAASSLGMAVGDMTQARLQYASEVTDPKRFGSADRQAEAAQAQDGAIAQHLADNVGRTGALAAPYAALDFLGPAGTLATGGAKGVAAQGMKAIGKKGVGEVAGEFVNESGQEVVNVAGDIMAGERSSQLTGADASRVLNAGAVGAVMGAGGHTANVIGDKATQGMKDRRAAEDGDVAKAIEIAAREKGFLRPAQQRAEVMNRLDDVAATHGIKPSIVQKIKDAAESKPLASLGGWLKNVVSNLAESGAVAPLDAQTLSMLDEPVPPAPMPGQAPAKPAAAPSAPPLPLHQRAPAQPTTQEQQLADSVARDLGVPPDVPTNPPTDAPATTEDYSGLDTAPQTPPPAGQPIDGEPINRNWSTFAPRSGTLKVPNQVKPASASTDGLTDQARAWDQAQGRDRIDAWFEGAMVDGQSRAGFADALANGGSESSHPWHG